MRKYLVAVRTTQVTGKPSCAFLTVPIDWINPFSRAREFLRSLGVDFRDVKEIKVKNEDGTISKKLAPNPAVSSDEVEFDFACYIAKDAPIYRDHVSAGETDEDAKKRFGVENLDINLPYRIISKDKLPVGEEVSHDKFRAAWHDEANTQTIDIDLDAAKELKKDELRELRQPLLYELDIDQKRAFISGDSETVSDCENKLQALRDITKAGLPDDVNELRAFLPTILIEN